MAFEIRIGSATSPTETLPNTASTIKRSFDQQANATLVTNRPDLNAITLADDAEIYLRDTAASETVFGGVLRTPVRNGPAPQLLVGSFERYAMDAEPVGTPSTDSGDSTYSNVADTAPVTDAIDAVSQLSAGTVENVKSGLDFVFTHVSQARKLRTIRDATGGELAYPADKTVDYVGSLGSDKTGTVIGPGQGNVVENTFEVTRQESAPNTHFRILGPGDGNNQREVNVVPSADTASYRNKATYSSSWSFGDRRVWPAPISNKDLKSVGALQAFGAEVATAGNTDRVDVDCVVKGETVELGDEFRVTNSSENVDQDLRAVEVTEVIDSAGRRYETRFSNVHFHRESGALKEQLDVERYNRAFEGALTYFTAGGDRLAVDSTHQYALDLYYPSDVKYEERVELKIKGLPYRAGVSATGHTHSVDVTHPSHSHSVDVTHPSHSHSISTTSADNADFTSVVVQDQELSAFSISDNGAWQAVDSFSVGSNDTSMLIGQLWLDHDDTGTPERQANVRMKNTTTGDEFPNVGGVNLNLFEESMPGFWAIDPTNVNGDSFEMQALVNDAAGTLSGSYSTYWVGVGRHTHGVSDTSSTALGTTNAETSDAALGSTSNETAASTAGLQPGIAQFDGVDESPAHYPESITVQINGSSPANALSFTSGTDDGTQSFEATLDIAGELVAGAWNRITVSSGGLGDMNATVSADVYRQVLGDG